MVAQARSRLAGQMPDGATRLVSLHDPDARPIRKGRIDRPVEFGYKAQVLDNDDGIVVDYTVERGAAPDGPQLAPAIERVRRRAGQVPRAVTADRGYGQAAVERDLHAAGVRTVAIPRQATTSAGPQGRRARPRLPQAGQVAHRLRRPDQLPQTRLRLGPHPPGRQARERRSGAGTGYSPTTWPRSRPWPADPPQPRQPPGTRDRTQHPCTTTFSGRSKLSWAPGNGTTESARMRFSKPRRGSETRPQRWRPGTDGSWPSSSIPATAGRWPVRGARRPRHWSRRLPTRTAAGTRS